MKKYRKIQTEVEAEQFYPDKKPWPEGVKESPHDFWGTINKHFYYLDTPEASMEIDPGDYVITDVDGNQWLCEEEWFENDYELVEE